LNNDTANLVDRFRQGDDGAAEELFHRYMERLTRLARSRLSSKLASRLDPEDIVLSAYRSFFVALNNGRFEFKRSGDLWRLLVQITMNKLYRQVAHHTADRRAVDVEHNNLASSQLEERFVTTQPGPEEAAALADELETFMAALPSRCRRVFELRLQGERIAEIASDTQQSQRSVRRQLASIRQQLAKRNDDQINANG
jgi:RNA polymerase sigma factor (sigma-70 family)